MKFIVILIFELLALLVFFNIDVNTEMVSLVLVFVNTIVFCIIFGKTTQKKIGTILIFALLLRTVVMFVDLYTNIPIVFSGTDSETFDEIAKGNVMVGYFAKSLTGYTDLLTLIYLFFDSQRVIAQYVNVVLGVSSIYLLYRILELLQIDQKDIIRTCFFMTIFPAYLFISSVLLRDVLVIFFTMSSLYFFILWYNKPLKRYTIMTFLMLFIAAYFHSGVVFLAVGFIYFFTFWNPKKKKLNFSIKSLFSLAILSLPFLFILSNPDFFLDKFARLDEQNLASSVASDRVEAGSRYLSWVKPSNIFELILYSPLKMLYFIFSPMPWDVRNILDIITIIFDSSIFYFLFYGFWKYRVKDGFKKSMILNSLVIGAYAVIFAFSWGVVASGTAMRHREKILMLLIIIYLLRKKEYEETISYNHYIRKS